MSPAVKRQIVIGVALAATLAAAWFAPDDKGGVVGPARASAAVRPEPAVVASAVPMDPGPLTLRPREDGDDVGNPFDVPAWQPLPVMNGVAVKPAFSTTTKPVAAGSAKTQAPTPSGPAPIDVQLLGQYSEHGQTTWLLRVNGREMAAQAGQDLADGLVLAGADADALRIVRPADKQELKLAIGE